MGAEAAPLRLGAHHVPSVSVEAIYEAYLVNTASFTFDLAPPGEPTLSRHDAYVLCCDLRRDTRFVDVDFHSTCTGKLRVTTGGAMPSREERDYWDARLISNGVPSTALSFPVRAAIVFARTVMMILVFVAVIMIMFSFVCQTDVAHRDECPSFAATGAQRASLAGASLLMALFVVVASIKINAHEENHNAIKPWRHANVRAWVEETLGNEA